MFKLKVSLAFIATFAFISCLGLFCALAGGVQWGTFNAGMVSTMTLMVAVGLGAIIAGAVGMDIHGTDRLP